MPTSNFFKLQAFPEAVAHGKHDFSSDTLKVTLTNAANAPAATDAVLTDITAISLTFLANDDIAITSSAQTGGTYKLTLTDKTLTASGGSVGPFQYAVVYNNIATNKDLVGYVNYGSEITLADGESVQLNFDDANGVLTIA